MRLVIRIGWRASDMPATSFDYEHPECAVKDHPVEVVTAMQIGGKVDMRRNDSTLESLEAINFRDLYREATCVMCGGLLREPPAHTPKVWTDIS